MKINTLPLKIVVSFVLIITSILLIIFGIGLFEVLSKSEISFIKVLFYLAFFLSLIVNFLSFTYIYKILRYMDKDVIFTKEILMIIKKIKKNTYYIFAILWGILPLMIYASVITKIYVVVPIALVFIFSPLIFSTFTAVIEQLLISIIEIKTENDLTV